MNKIKFDCGCEFKVLDEHIKNNDSLPGLFIDYENLRLDCPKTWDLFEAGNTRGVFQLETNLGRAWSKRIKPRNIQELSALIALLRPGALKAVIDGKTTTQRYTDRKSGEEAVVPIDPAISDILDNTYQCLVFQEQTALISQRIAGFSLQEADGLRKAMGKKDSELMAKVGKQFIDGCDKVKVVSTEKGQQIWDIIKKSERYLFNASHSVSYAFLSYQTAYAKAHFPRHFYTAWLKFANEKLKPQEEVRDLVADAKGNDIDILPPSIIQASQNIDCALIKNQIYLGLTNIKGIGESAIKRLILSIETAERLLQKDISKFSWYEVLVYILRDTTSTVVNNSISTGVLSIFNMPRKHMLYDYSIISELTDKEIANCKATSIKELLYEIKNKKLTKKRSMVIESLINLFENPTTSLEDKMAWIANKETALIGISLTCSKIDSLDIIDADTTCKEVTNGKRGKMILCVEIKHVKEHFVKQGANKGSKMAFLTVSDESGYLDNIVAFPTPFSHFANMLYENNTVTLIVKSNKDSFIIEDVRQI